MVTQEWLTVYICLKTMIYNVDSIESYKLTHFFLKSDIWIFLGDCNWLFFMVKCNADRFKKSETDNASRS